MINRVKYLIRRHLGKTLPYRLASEINKSISDLRGMDRRVVRLTPGGEIRGNVLLSYILPAFFHQPNDPVFFKHTHYWETLQIAKTWLELGYSVDAIHWKNQHFVPEKRYDFFIDVRSNLERIAPLLNHDCVKIMHIETAHWLFHMTAQHQRLLDLQRRRGKTIRPCKVVDPNWGIEHADCATILGNEFTRRTFEYANKPFYDVPLSVPFLYPFPERKNFEKCRKNFLWFGSGGLVHKGLDLVLEAFTQMPDLNLTVCGPVKEEKDFERVYEKELYSTPNINTVGWVDVGSRVFYEIALNCASIIYPSCSEGGGAGVIICLHTGLIPIISYETGIDLIDGMGIILRKNTVEDIKLEAKKIAVLPVEELRIQSRKAWEYARSRHTREIFQKAYRKTAEMIINAYYPKKIS